MPAYRGSTEDAWALFARTALHRFAFTDGDGAPVLRTLNGVVHAGALVVHGGRAGEKVAMVGRPVVVAAEEHLATIPSTFVDPELACPATTYYRSAMAWGVAESVDDPAAKAAALQALMERQQPEGGHLPVDAREPRYAKELRRLVVIRVAPRRLEARFKLHQQKPAARMEKVLEGLWRRGGPGDLDTLEAVRAAHPAELRPDCLAVPEGVLRVRPGAAALEAAVALVAQAYWNVGVPRDVVAKGHEGSSAWMVIEERGEVRATARAQADGKNAWIYDVAVAPAHQGRGLGTALLRRLLDHPALRGCQRVFLMTKDAQRFYARLGFAEPSEKHATMVLHRAS